MPEVKLMDVVLMEEEMGEDGSNVISRAVEVQAELKEVRESLRSIQRCRDSYSKAWVEEQLMVAIAKIGSAMEFLEEIQTPYVPPYDGLESEVTQ